MITLSTGAFSLLESAQNLQPKVPRWLRSAQQASLQHKLLLRERGEATAVSARRAVFGPKQLAAKVQHLKSIRGHRMPVYCIVYDRTGEYVITGADDRMVKVRAAP